MALKRFTALILAIVMTIGMFPVYTSAEEGASGTPVILYDGTPEETVVLPHGDCVHLAVKADEAAAYQWQIRAAEDLWVDISSATDSTLRVSYGMVASLLMEDAAYLRCAVTDKNGNTSETDPVQIQVSYEPVETPAVFSFRRPIAPEPLPAPVAVENAPAQAVQGEAVPEMTPEIIPEATQETMAAESLPEESEEETVPLTTEPEAPEAETVAEEEIQAAEEPTAPETVPEETRVRSSASAPPVMLSADLPNEDVSIHTVTIEYVYAAGSKFAGQRVALPYIAEVAEGDSLDESVISPNCVGYTPDIEKIDLSDFGEVTGNISRTVSYSPAMVSYTVRHYQQNIENDEYTWVDTTLSSGYTEALTSDDAAKTYTGFTALSHYHEEIAADSSTTIDIYYDRNYYLMSFDLGGGYGVDPVYARYGTEAGNVATPTRTGYTFSAWSLDGKNAAALPKTIPAENRTYIALWNAETSTYTIVYWNADLDDGAASTPTTYSYWGKKTVTVASDTVLTPADVGAQHPATSAGFAGSDEAPYFAYESAVTAANNPTSVEVEGDGSSVINVYYSRKVYEIRYLYARSYKSGQQTRYQIATLTGDGTVGGTQQTSVSAVPSITDSHFSPQTEKIGDYTYYYISIRAEYGANIEAMWPAAAIGDIGNYKWGSWAAEKGTGYRTKYGNEHANIVGAYPVMSADMIKNPNDSVAQRMTAWWGSNQGIAYHAYHIYYQVLPGQAYDAVYNGKYYKLDRTSIFTAAHNGSTRVDPFEYSGFTVANEDKNSQANSQNNKYHNNKDCPNNTGHEYCNVFYYDRNGYTLSFYNYNDSSAAPATQSLMFGQSLLSYKVEGEPAYPTGVEPGSLEFAGWYTTPECHDGTEVNWNSVMPASNLTLYAKWILVTHDVSVYLTESDANQGTNQLGQTVQVTHDDLVPERARPATPVNGEDTFVGWFYRDENGQEQAFSFATMAITQDMKIYAKWRSNSMKEVVIRYVVEDDNGNQTPIADDETLMLRLGSTRTFEAKTGNSLYEEYRTGCFPTSSSHSVTPEAADLETEEPITYTFVYKQYGAVPYNVEYYVEEMDGTIRPAFAKDQNGKAVFVSSETYNSKAYDKEGLKNDPFVEEHKDNDRAVVTELYVPEGLSNPAWALPDDYIPNALKIQQVIVPGTDNAYNDENTIVFTYRYAPGVAIGLYSVNHYIQNANETGEFDLYSYKEYSGDVGSTVSDSAVSIPGYTYSETITGQKKQTGNTLKGETMSGTIDSDDSLELNFYYTVNPYPYQVMYLEKDTNRVLLDAKTHEGTTQLTGLYGAKVTEHYVEIDGYDVDAESKSIYIQQEAGNTASINTIVFYYSRKSADLILSKEVALDPEQAAEEGITQLPAEVYDQEFSFTVYCATGFHKSVYDATLKDTNDAQSEIKVVAGARTLTVTLKPGQEIAIHELAMGDYTVTETYVPGFRTSVEGTIKQAHDVALEEANQDVKVEFLNTFPFYTGDLVVRKNVVKLDDSDPTATEPYRVTVTLHPEDAAREVDRMITWTDGDGTAKTYTIPALTGAATDAREFSFDVLVPAGGEVKLEGTPVGTFTVEEKTQETGYITDFYKVTYNKALHQNDEVTGTNHVVGGEVHGGHPTAVTFTNTYKKGDLTIRKTVTQEYEKDNWSSDTFTFQVAGTTELPDGDYAITVGGADGTATVANGAVSVKIADNDPVITVSKTEGAASWTQSLTIENLPAGTYTVTETASANGLDKYVSVEPAAGLKLPEENAQTAAEFTNLYKRNKGNLTLKKVIALVEGTTMTIDTDKEFKFTIQLKDRALTTGDWIDVSADGVGYEVKDGLIHVTLKHEQSIAFNGLPVGEYIITEGPEFRYQSDFGTTDENGYSSREVTIDMGETENVICTNLYPIYVADLTIKKVVSGTGMEPGDSFVFYVSGADTSTSSVVDIPVVITYADIQAGNNSVTLGDLPLGQYTVREDTAWSWRYALTGEASRSITLEASGNTVTFENTRTNNQWLSGTDARENNLTTPKT